MNAQQPKETVGKYPDQFGNDLIFLLPSLFGVKCSAMSLYHFHDNMHFTFLGCDLALFSPANMICVYNSMWSYIFCRQMSHDKATYYGQFVYITIFNKFIQIILAIKHLIISVT